MTDWINNIDWSMILLIIGFLIFWFYMAIKHPIATFVALGLTYWDIQVNSHGVLSSTNIINSYMIWSVIVSLFVTRLGQVFLITFGLGFIVNFFIANGGPD